MGKTAKERKGFVPREETFSNAMSIMSFQIPWKHVHCFIWQHSRCLCPFPNGPFRDRLIRVSDRDRLIRVSED